MASFPEIATGTQTVPGSNQEGRTTSRPDQTRQAKASTTAPGEPQTTAHVGPKEEGAPSVKDLHSSACRTTSEAPESQDSTVRQQQARDLCATVTRMISSHGTVRMASHLQLLRRDLSKCHEVLGPLTNESDFLSIVVLVELELGNKDWKAITKAELHTLKNALQVGVSEPRVTFDHYNQTARLLIAGGWSTGPIIEIDTSANETDEHVQ